MSDEKVETVKNLRVSIDRVIKEAKELGTLLDRQAGGREISITITKLQEGKMWAGKALEELGHQLPEEYRDEAK